MTNSKQVLIRILICSSVIFQPHTIESLKIAGSYEWQCQNQQIIASDELCDGKKDCTDGTDEITESCLHIQCPKFSFRCLYGACVAGNAACNQIQDCADNSDESDNLCSPASSAGKLPANSSVNSTNNSTTSQKCPDYSFECDNGDCITNDLTCDGKADCSDHSDEISKTCSASNCPAFAFRCGYGACINGDLKCNHHSDCYDNSDESPALCGGSSSSSHIPIPITTRRVTTSQQITTSTTPSPNRNRQGCQYNYIEDLQVSYLATKQEIIPGQYVENYVPIKYTCRPRHLLQGVSENSCIDNHWTDEHPKCIKYCPSETILGVTIQSTCELNRTRVSCDTPILPGTQVTISCQFGYQKPTELHDDILICDKFGNWDNIPYRCVQVCGEEHPDYNPFIIGGSKTNITKVPWHVGIYSNRDRSTNLDYEQICGGTIVNAKIVISAAHCFWDILNSRVFDKSFFRVGAGKYYRDYNANELLPIQYEDLVEIHISNGYQDAQLSYINDIAVLVLKNYLNFKFYIRPACLEWNLYNERRIASNILGRVAGWGTTATKKPSTELRSVELSTLSYEDCRQQTEREYQNLITGDKFCVASNNNGQTVCTGDSGGGFVIPKTNQNGVKRYYLYGIVSNGINSMGECTGDFLTAYTNIQFYKEMVQSYMDMYKVK